MSNYSFNKIQFLTKIIQYNEKGTQLANQKS